MATQITLTLSDRVYDYARQLAELSGRDIASVLSDTLENTVPEFVADVMVNVVELSDADVRTLADTHMDAEQSSRLSLLLQKNREDQLSAPERIELEILMQVYDINTLRKAQGLAEAVRRGLLPPLTP